MRTVGVLIVGIALGVALTLGYIRAEGGRYSYFILAPDDCHALNGNAVTAEVVPNQPNPCHFRRPRY